MMFKQGDTVRCIEASNGGHAGIVGHEYVVAAGPGLNLKRVDREGDEYTSWTGCTPGRFELVAQEQTTQDPNLKHALHERELVFNPAALALADGRDYRFAHLVPVSPTFETLEVVRKAACPHLPADPAARKSFPLASGLLDYFPDALLAVAHVSQAATDQHHPGELTHWDRNKSVDEANTLMRHFLDRGTLDTDGLRHSAKVAWRALALLQKEIEAAR